MSDKKISIELNTSYIDEPWFTKNFNGMNSYVRSNAIYGLVNNDMGWPIEIMIGVSGTIEYLRGGVDCALANVARAVTCVNFCRDVSLDFLVNNELKTILESSAPVTDNFQMSHFPGKWYVKEPGLVVADDYTLPHLRLIDHCERGEAPRPYPMRPGDKEKTIYTMISVASYCGKVYPFDRIGDSDLEIVLPKDIYMVLCNRIAACVNFCNGISNNFIENSLSLATLLLNLH